MNRLLLIIFVLTSSVGCDQSSKYLASEWLANSSMITFLNDSLRLTYAENHGGFLSLGGSLPEQYRFWIFVVIVSMVLISMFCYLLINRQLSPLHFYGVCLVLGGGLSNLIDRVTNQGAVV
ncbi:MAG: signal peptidase II, partial [Gammaproteobacteria bacterium]|nr:signal peptidase II [Gammaproteobacteria bacterium]